MKRVILILAVIVAATAAQAQIEFKTSEKLIDVGEVKLAGIYQGSISKSVSTDHTTYFFRFKDYEYLELNETQSFWMIDRHQDFEDLYQMIILNLEQGTEDWINFPVGDGTEKCRLYFTKKRVYFFFTDFIDYHSTAFNAKQIAKLFGKEYKRKK